MTTDPGDLVLDPTCGSGTTAYVAEQWGRRWITIDTSRVALALARARIMGARYPYYLLADSREGQEKEAEIERKSALRAAALRRHPPGIRLPTRPPHHPARHRQQRRDRRHLGGFPGTAGAAAGGSQQRSWHFVGRVGNPARGGRKLARKKSGTCTQLGGNSASPARRRSTPPSTAKADYEYLYDKPYEDRNKVRVAGPFTVESISPHRTLAVDENDEFVDTRRRDARRLRLRRHHPRQPAHRRRAAGAQRGPHLLHLP